MMAESNPSINHDVCVSRDQILSQQHKTKNPTAWHMNILPLTDMYSRKRRVVGQYLG